MAFTPYHNIVGSTTQSVELIGLNDTAKASIKSIQITNISLSAAATVDLFLYKDSTDTTAEEYYYFLRKYQISYRDYLILDNIKTKEQNNIALTTLFKDDYELFPFFYEYYKNQGVEHFYMYYNGILNDILQENSKI